jgi:HlyD family secretion protein
MPLIFLRSRPKALIMKLLTMKKKMVIAAILMIILISGGFYLFRKDGTGLEYRTAQITRGDIRAAVTATGTVNAVTTVLVGTQVSGTIQKIFVDYNSPVKKGQLLAQIDPALPQAKVDQARANLQSAVAGVEKAEATLLDARRTMERNRTLFARNYIARSDLDTAETNHQSALAQINVAKAQVAQTRAELQQEETTLRYTRILSPVEGIVISRNVDIGQTVAASFQTPTLFNIAQDLTRMQIDTSVDEADIGRVQVGQAVRFTVDAYPDLNFTGKVAEVRNAPTTVSNVVTYGVIIKVANPDLRLKPGMTANVSIVTATREGVLRVPNAALRFKGPAESASKKTTAGAVANMARSAPASDGQKKRDLWTLADRKPRNVSVGIGITDGSFTELTFGPMKEGDSVILEAVSNSRKKTDTIPRPPGFLR